ncbi:hypothetical protein OSTOST_25998 [Ostertagia ostertagi]
MGSSDFDKVLESLDRANRGIRRQSAWERTLSFIDNINKKPPPTQMAVGGAAGLYLDVCEPMDVESLKNHAIDGKTIHVLINNAGLSMRGAIEDTPIKIYKQLMDVNFFGHVVVTQKLLEAIPDDGCIIATSSVQGKIVHSV